MKKMRQKKKTIKIIRLLVHRGWSTPEDFSDKTRSQQAFHFSLFYLFAFEDCDSFTDLQNHLSLENNCTKNQGANAFLIVIFPCPFIFLQEGVIYKHLHMS